MYDEAPSCISPFLQLDDTTSYPTRSATETERRACLMLLTGRDLLLQWMSRLVKSFHYLSALRLTIIGISICCAR